MRTWWRRLWLRRRAYRSPSERRQWSPDARAVQALLSAVLGIGLALFAIRAFDASVRPTLTVLAQAQVKNAVTRIVDDAVNRTVSQETIAYGDIITLQTDNSGRITALTSNSAEMNRLRSEIVDDIVAQVEALDTPELGVAFGNVTGLSSLADKGPRLPVRIRSVGTVDAEFRNLFTEAGINQTYHQVMLDVSVELKLLIPGGAVETTVTTQVNVAETVIVGQVPDAYLQLGTTPQ